MEVTVRETIFLIALASANSGIALRLVEPLLPRLATDFGVSVSIAAAVITAYSLSNAGSQLLCGPLGDRFGKCRVVTLSMMGASAASFGCVIAWDVISLSVMRTLTGLFTGSAFTLGMAYIGDRVPLADRQPVIARFVAGTISGQALGPLLGGALTDWIGWRGAFAALGAIFAVLSIVLLVRTGSQWADEAKQGPLGNPFKTYLEVIRFSRVRYVLVISFLEMFLFFGAYSFLGAFLKQRFDLSLTLIGGILAAYGVGALLFTVVVRRLLLLLGQRSMIVWGGSICFGCYVVLMLTPVWLAAVPCAVALGFAFYMFHNTIQTKATEMSPEARATGLALYSGSWALGQAMGVAVMGVAISVVGFAPGIIVFGAGYFVLAIWLRANLDRL